MSNLPEQCKGCPLANTDKDGVEWCLDIESSDSGEHKCWASDETKVND